MLAVDGRSGAGKTTLAQRLAAPVPGAARPSRSGRRPGAPGAGGAGVPAGCPLLVVEGVGLGR